MLNPVTVPPSPETLKTIRDLVAGVTGFNMDRGDQLIVETLPFEPVVVDADFVRQSPAPPKTPGPAWLEMITKYRDVFLIGLAGLAVLMVCLRTGLKMLSGRGNKAQTAELDQTPAVAAGASPYAAIPNSAADRADISPNTRKDLLLDANDTTAERIRELAQRDVNATANVLRMWMQNQKA
jgi:flagellar biosynthesis/type III secretory pathway M-ring protein FliF/YscJ